jgi:hypothetical protein
LLEWADRCALRRRRPAEAGAGESLWRALWFAMAH